MSRRVLFVCAGNTCRSPMAAALARAKGMSADSAGVECGSGLPAAENAVTVMSERGLDIAWHRSKAVEDIDFSLFDVVVAMTPSIAMSLARSTPRRIVTWSVNDPYRCPLERYRAVADEIDENLSALSLLEHDAN